MFQCFLRARRGLFTWPVWQTFLTIPGSRGIKLSKLAPITRPTSTNATIVTGHEWQDQLLKNGIGCHNETEKFRSIKDVINLKTASRHIRKFTDEPYFTSPAGHSAAEAVVRRYLRDHKEKPLWCITTVYSGDKAVVRAKAKYRFNAAFNQALKNAGYDTAGKRVRQSKSGRGNPAISELFGTLHIMTYQPKDALKVPFTELESFFEQAVKGLEQRLGRTKTSKVQVQRRERPAQPTAVGRAKGPAQKLEHQAQHISFRRVGGLNPRSREPQPLSEKTSRGRGDGSKEEQFWKLGDSRTQSNQQTRARNRKPINTEF